MVSAIGAVSVQLAESSGEVLKEQVGQSAALTWHAELAELMMPWALALTVTSFLAWYAWRLTRDAEACWLPGARRAQPWLARGGRWVPVALSVLTVIAAVGILMVVVLVGDAGAKAVWAA